MRKRGLPGARLFGSPWPLLAATLALALPLAGCNDATGPDLSVEVREGPLEPTGSSGEVCCCRPAAVVVNTSSVPLHVALRWVAYDAQDNEIGAGASAFVQDIQPGTEKAAEPAAFLTSCASITRHERTRTDLVGLWTP